MPAAPSALPALSSPFRTFWRQPARLLLAACCALGVSVAHADTPALWLENGHLRADAQQAVAILRAADTDGLRPQDYAADSLAQTLDRAATLDAEALAGFDAALTQAMVAYLDDLHQGRVTPGQANENFPQPQPLPDGTEAYLRHAVEQHRLADAVREAAPQTPLYARLRTALAHYRELAGNPVWSTPLPKLPGRKLQPGQAWSGCAALSQRLVVLGDLDTPVSGHQYAGALVDGVKRFQARHGLEADGVIGKGSFEALQVGAAARARQIELSMERLRWLPALSGDRLIVVNIPAYQLRAYAQHDGQWQQQVAMDVIVGRAKDAQTPVFDEKMRYIEFSPYWNVPPSIVHKELVPHLRKDPGFFAAQGFELVGSDGAVFDTLTEDKLDALQHGHLRVRQRPGTHNPLGDIKFAFPNNDNIYLHHTASPGLFSREQRDLSHGCVRVVDPVALARFVLADKPDWDEARIRKAMDKGSSNFLRLDDEIPVLISYITATVAEDGQVRFFSDIYQHDDVLERALQKHARRLSFTS